MNARARVLAPDSIDLELTLVMSVAQWKELAKALPERWPGWAVGSLITKAINGSVEHIETAREIPEP